jgi:DNA-binding transcriptional MerR regulator
MADDELLTIGRFARISGLSVHTLRHYDDIDLLTPVDVDPDTGYRRYRRDQVRSARLIQALRWIDLPLDQVRPVMADVTGEATPQILNAHRGRLSRQANLLAARVADVDHDGVDSDGQTRFSVPDSALR